MRNFNDIVMDLKEIKLVDYNPQEIVVDFVNNFWLKEYNLDSLCEMTIEVVVESCKEIYKNQFPNANEELLTNFANDVIFNICYELSKI